MNWSFVSDNKKKIIAAIAVIIAVIIFVVLLIVIYTITSANKPSEELTLMVENINSML